MILTRENGTVIEKPSRLDHFTDSDYCRAFHAWKDEIARVANAGFDAGFRAEMKGATEMSKLEKMLDGVKYAERELTLDVADLTPVQIEQIKTECDARGLHVSGTHRWLLVRAL